MEFFDNKGNLTPYGKQQIFDLAVKQTKGMPIVGGTTIYGNDPNLKWTNPNIGMRFDDPNAVYYTNKDFYLNTNKPINKQSQYVIESIMRSPEAQRDAAYIMQEFGSNLPTGVTRTTPYTINEYVPNLPIGLNERDVNEISAIAKRAEELGTQGTVVPQRSGTVVYSNKPLTAIDIDNRVAAKNIGGAPELKPYFAVQDKIDEITEGYSKANKYLNRSLSLADKAANFMIQHPTLMKTAKIGGKVMAPVGLVMQGLGAYEGLTGQGAGISPALMGIISGPDAARLMKENAADAAYSSRDKSFSLDTPEEREAYKRTIFNRQYENLE